MWIFSCCFQINKCKDEKKIYQRKWEDKKWKFYSKQVLRILEHIFTIYSRIIRIFFSSQQHLFDKMPCFYTRRTTTFLQSQNSVEKSFRSKLKHREKWKKMPTVSYINRKRAEVWACWYSRRETLAKSHVFVRQPLVNSFDFLRTFVTQLDIWYRNHSQ